jgi:hypothetical protein
MTRIFLLLVASLALALPAWAQQWTEYRPANGAFRVEFPGTPTASSQTTPSGTPTQSAHLTLAHGVYLTVVTSAVSPASAARPVYELLDILRNAQLKATNGKMREEHSVTLNGANGRMLVIDTPREIALYTLLLPKDDTLYQVTYAAARSAETPEDMKHFINSFRLLTN